MRAASGAGRIQARPRPVGQLVLARQQDDVRLAGPDGGPIETCAAMSNDIGLFPSPSSPSRTATSPSETCAPAKTNARASAARGPGARTPTRCGTGRVAPVRGRSAAGPSRGRTRSPQALPAATMAPNAHPERQASGQRPSSSGRIDSEASQSSCAGHRALQPAPPDVLAGGGPRGAAAELAGDGSVTHMITHPREKAPVFTDQNAHTQPNPGTANGVRGEKGAPPRLGGPSGTAGRVRSHSPPPRRCGRSRLNLPAAGRRRGQHR